MVACEKGHSSIVELLLNKGADVEAKNKVRTKCKCVPTVVSFYDLLNVIHLL